jgi:hypothetical protein
VSKPTSEQLPFTKESAVVGAVRALVAIAVGVAAARQVSAQQIPLADSVMRLNRAGLWERAEQVARLGLADSSRSLDERCALRFNAITALVKLGAVELASSDLEVLDNQCAESPVTAQQATKLKSMRAALALPALPRTGMDFSSIGRFWHVADLLVKDIEPSDSEWWALLTSTGYRLSLQQVPTTRTDMEIALRPTRRHDFDSLTTIIKDRPDQANRVRHIAGAVTHRAALMRLLDSLTRALPIPEAVAVAAKFLPLHATEHVDPPLVAFAIFRDDGYSLGPQGVVLDLDGAYQHGRTTPFLAHEFHHSYLSALSKIAWPPPNDPAGPLFWALNAMRNEGIADLIDKPHPLAYPGDSLMSRYAARYNEAYARTPQVLRAIDSLLVIAADDSTQLQAIGHGVQTLLPSAGHFNGSYVAREIYETFGVDSLFPGVANQFAFLRTYAAAEKQRGNSPPFSPKAVALLDMLEKRYQK